MNPIGSPTNFPQGFANGLSVRGMPLLQSQTGQVFFVGNSAILNPGQRQGSDGNRGTYLDPFATLQYAVNTACMPGRGDIVFVLQGHAETITNATTFLMQCSGVAVIGLGAGAMRPTLTFTTATTANIPVVASNASIQNILFVGNFLSIASTFTGKETQFTGVIDAGGLLTVSALTGTLYPGVMVEGTTVAANTYIISQLTGTTGAAGTYNTTAVAAVASASMTTGYKDFSIDNCEFKDKTGSLGFLSIFTFSATANYGDGFQMTRCNWWSLSSVSPTVAVVTAVSEDRVNMSDNVMVSPTTAVTEGPVALATGAGNMTNFTFGRNRLVRPGVSTTLPGGISTSATAWTGSAFDNYVGLGLSGATGTWISTGSKISLFNNYAMITRAADKSALINPAAV
tara:strand:- start:16169 stop:17365 length:1197 start_codon:yes stop_codon:yes gene_type:complete